MTEIFLYLSAGRVDAVAPFDAVSIDCRALQNPWNSMSGQSAEEALMAKHLVETLGLEHVRPADIPPAAPLFGSGLDSVGLDSIDALEIALMIQQQYGVELRSDDADVRSAFASLRSLTEHVMQRRQA
jgi:acyl carrier protein